MDGALYRPTATVACGTTTAADDSLVYEVDKVVKKWGFQRIDGQNLQDVSGLTRSHLVNPENILSILSQTTFEFRRSSSIRGRR